MKIKLTKEEKYWNKIGKWCVAYIAPDYGHLMRNCFHENRATADARALEEMKESVRWNEGMRRATESSEIVVEVSL